MKTIEEEFPPAIKLYNPDDLRGKYDELRARAVDMERNLFSVITNDHESKEAFIARVREILFPAP